MDVYYVSCNWSGRTEPDEQFAKRAADWFHELSRIDPLLQRWYLSGKGQAGSRILAHV